MKMLINIDVPDLDAALAFYQAALGLTHSRTIDDDVAELSGASCLVYLLEKAPGTATDPTAARSRQYSRHWTPVHIDFVVDNIEAAAQRALLAGARQESGFVDWMGSTCASFSDPFGNGFCLIRFSGETYDATAG
ncbi:MAG: VOC family protein [Noviherbaspirillum sp.]